MLVPTLLLALSPLSPLTPLSPLSPLSPLTAADLRCVDAHAALAVVSAPSRGPSTAPGVLTVADADSTLVAAYAAGESWERFLGAARAGRARWVKHWETAVVPADALAQARALPAGFRLLVIAVDACSDSINTIPYLAKLVAEVPALDMRIIAPMVARPLMTARPTPDGRAATPTVILLDAEGNEVGCWIERPAALQAMAMEARAAGSLGSFLSGKQEWYDADAGASTIREIVALLTAAAGGKRGCDASAGARGQ